MLRRTQLINKRTDPYKDFVFGSELITDGNFDNGSTDWTTLGSEWSITNNVATFSGVNNGTSSMRLGQGIASQTFGTWFKIEFDISNTEAGKSAYFSIPGNWNGKPTFNHYTEFEEGHHVLFVEGSSNPEADFVIFGISPSVTSFSGGFSISNISVKSIIEGTALYGEELVKNGGFTDGLNNWEDQEGNTGNWLVTSNGVEHQGLNEAAIMQDVGDNETLYKLELDVELNGGTYRVLDANGDSLFLKNGRNVIFTTLFFGRIYIKPATEVLGATVTNVSVKKVIHIPFVSENLVVNGDFSNGLTDWSITNPAGSNGWSEINGEAVCSNTATVANRNLAQSVMIADRFYDISFDIISNTSYIDFYAYYSYLRSSDTGSKHYLLQAKTANLLFYAATGNSCSIDNVSCRLINIIPKGENVLLNGNFSHEYNWKGTHVPEISINNGKMDFNTTNSYGAYQNVLIPGRTYKLIYQISNYTSGEFRPYTMSTGYMTPRNTNGVFEEEFTIDSTDTGIFYLRSATGFSGSISNVVLKEV